MDKIIVIIFLLIATVSKTQASMQSPEKVLFEGYQYNLFFYPLEKYFQEHPDRKPKRETIFLPLHRGYQATFEIKNNLLRLHDLRMHRRVRDKPHSVEFKSVKHEIFKGEQSDVLDWFSGILVLPYGEVVRGAFVRRNSIYTHYLLMEIKQGRLMEKRRYDLIDYEFFKDRQFQAFKKLQGYRDKVLNDKPWEKDDENLDGYIRRLIPYFSKEFLVD